MSEAFFGEHLDAHHGDDAARLLLGEHLAARGDVRSGGYVLLGRKGVGILRLGPRAWQFPQAVLDPSLLLTVQLAGRRWSPFPRTRQEADDTFAAIAGEPWRWAAAIAGCRDLSGV